MRGSPLVARLLVLGAAGLVGAGLPPARAAARDAPPPRRDGALAWQTTPRSAGRVEAPAGAGAPAEAAFRFAVAKALAEDGSLREALPAFEEAASLAPRDPYVRLEYGRLLFRLGRPGQGMEQAEAARRLAPDEPVVLRFYAESRLAMAETDPQALPAAREALERLRRIDPADLQAAVSLGQVYLSEGEAARAAEIFRQAARHHPGNRVLEQLLLDALLKADAYGDAAAVLAGRLAADPANLEIRLLLAEMQSRQGEHEAAVATLRGARGHQAGEPEVRRRLAYELHASGDRDAAMAALDELLAISPADLSGRYLKGLILADEGRLEEAERLLAEVLREGAESFDVLRTLVRVLREQGEAPAARRLLAERLAGLEDQQGGQEEPALRRRLQIALLATELEEWETVLDATASLPGAEPAPAAETSPNESLLRHSVALLRADALSRLDRDEEALDLLAGQAPAGTAAARDFSAKRAEILLGMGRVAEAEELLAPLAASGEVEALLAAAQAYQRHERYGDAIPLLQAALAERPEAVPALFGLGAAYERTGQRGEAVGAFRRVLELDPEFAPALNYLGYMWAERGEHLEQALDLVRQAVRLEPDNGAYVDSLGWAHYRLGNLDEAREHLERAGRLLPADATIQEHLGDLYLAIGERAKARQAYERALGLDAENAVALRRKLDDLQE